MTDHPVYPPWKTSRSSRRPTLVALLPALGDARQISAAEQTDALPLPAPRFPPASAKPIRSAAVSPEQVLLQLAGFLPTSLGEIPGALCRYRIDAARMPPSLLVCADPVHMAPDRDTARMIDGPALGLGDAEAQALTDAINTLLRADGLRVHCPCADRWYLEGLDAAALDTPPTSFVAGRPADAFLPAQSDAATWRRLMTEIQMLFHAHPVNEARLLRGQLPVNGIWFWGGAALPPRADRPALRVYADDPFAVGLCDVAEIARMPLPDYHHDDPDPGSTLAVSIDGELWVMVDCSPLSEWTWSCLSHLQTLLDTSQVSRVIIDCGDNQAFDLTRLRQGFWQRLKAGMGRS